jgi:hypothetical protein
MTAGPAVLADPHRWTVDSFDGAAGHLLGLMAADRQATVSRRHLRVPHFRAPSWRTAALIQRFRHA